MSHRLLSAVLIVTALPDFAAAGNCISRVIVRPTGTITNKDAVALEIQIVTPNSPAFLAEPTEVVVMGNEVRVDLFADAGKLFSPDSLVETVDLGRLPAGSYAYQVLQHPTALCDSQTVSGTFCVEDSPCNDPSCRCPVFSAGYTIVDLGTLGGFASAGLGINDLGQVCGGADRADGIRHAFLWNDGQMIDLGVLPLWSQSEAHDINNVAQVVGISTHTGSITSAFLWSDGTMIDLGHLTGGPSGNTAALAMNDAGQAVGISGVSVGVHTPSCGRPA